MPLIVYGGAAEQFNYIFDTPANGTSTEYQAYFIKSDDTVMGLNVDAEGPSGPTNWKSDVLVDRPIAPFQLFKGELDAFPQPSVATVTVAGGAGYILEGMTCLACNSATDGLMDIASPLEPGAADFEIGIGYQTGTVVNNVPRPPIGSGPIY